MVEVCLFILIATQHSIVWIYLPQFIHSTLMSICVLYRLWLLQITLLWTVLNACFGEHRQAFLLLWSLCFAIRVDVEVNIFVNVSCTFRISTKYIFRNRIAGSNGMHNYILSRYTETALQKYFNNIPSNPVVAASLCYLHCLWHRHCCCVFWTIRTRLMKSQIFMPWWATAFPTWPLKDKIKIM